MFTPKISQKMECRSARHGTLSDNLQKTNRVCSNSKDLKRSLTTSELREKKLIEGRGT